MSRPAVIRAVAGILEDGRGNVLLQRRRGNQVCAGQLEFPGGKIEPEEAPGQALARELAEEIGVEATEVVPWVRRSHLYPHGECVVDFMRVLSWKGDPSGREGQRVDWLQVRPEVPSGLLAANLEIWKWLRLPRQCAISSVETVGLEEHLGLWEKAQANGLRMIQIRDKGLDADERRRIAEKTLAACRQKSLVLYNGDGQTALSLGASGIHLDAAGLSGADSRPDFEWAGASCHDKEELMRARELGLDYALLSPVKRTRSHPEARPLGWKAFALLAENAGIPVFALGGVGPEDLPEALLHGAHGIAGISFFADS